MSGADYIAMFSLKYCFLFIFGSVDLLFTQLTTAYEYQIFDTTGYMKNEQTVWFFRYRYKIYLGISLLSK